MYFLHSNRCVFTGLSGPNGEKSRRIYGEDIIRSMKNLGFDNYVEPMRVLSERCSELSRAKQKERVTKRSHKKTPDRRETAIGDSVPASVPAVNSSVPAVNSSILAVNAASAPLMEAIPLSDRIDALLENTFRTMEERRERKGEMDTM